LKGERYGLFATVIAPFTSAANPNIYFDRERPDNPDRLGACCDVRFARPDIADA
jgi:hypothetical protein